MFQYSRAPKPGCIGIWGCRMKNRSIALDRFQNFLFVAPALIFFMAFSIYPLLKTFQLSLFEWNGVSPRMEFVGFRNYLDAFGDVIWWKSIVNGFYFAAFALLLMNPLALILAVLVYSKVRGGRFYRVVYYIPPIMAPLVVGYIWKWIYEPYGGILNTALDSLHLGSLKRVWLNDVKLVIPAISVASIWQGFGGSFILFWAGLQDIRAELYEAAKVDGATGWQQLRKITLPLLSKTYAIISILTVLGAMQLYPLIVAMTNGGPGFVTVVPTLRIFEGAFKYFRFGYASTLSVILGLILLTISLARLRMSKKK